jgi:hypoxanthine phosphoribosyltransferase
VNPDLTEIERILAEAERIFAPEELTQALDRMAAAITARLAGENPLVLCLLNGGLIVTGHLLTRLTFPLEVGYLHATRYGRETRGSQLEWLVRPAQELTGRTVLLVDDILDEGATLNAVSDYCRQGGAREVLTAVLVDKQHNRKVIPGLTGDFVGLVSPDRFLFGWGMDYQGYWRNAPAIYAVKGS